MAKNDLNKNRIAAERHEAAYQAQWNELFNREATVTNVIAGTAWDDNETCACGRNIKYCKFGTKECPL